ncbi:unnamed protein product, partial [Colletotrichum noveboracense]
MYYRQIQVFSNLDKAMPDVSTISGYHIPPVWFQWEQAYFGRLSTVIQNPLVPARVVKNGCYLYDRSINCNKACGNVTLMFETPETLWNCVTLATLSLLTRFPNEDPGRDRINATHEAEANRTLNFGELRKLDYPLRLLRGCALESCSTCGGCPLALTEFLAIPINSSRIDDLANVMNGSYCTSPHPGIDFDIAGPGVTGAAVVTFLGKKGTGLANISTVISWITNDTILKGVVAAGPRTFCQEYQEISLNPIKEPGRFLKFNSKYPFPIYLISAILALDWIIHTAYRRFKDNSVVKSFSKGFRRELGVINKAISIILGRYRFLCMIDDWWKAVGVDLYGLYRGVWALLELFTFGMCILALSETIIFLEVLKESSEGDLNFTKWAF